jgi:hypothetical protein
MNVITQAAQPVSAETLEMVLGTGDLSKLTPGQRVEYLTRTCETLGLNHLTRPFRFMTFQGATVMYATRDCADQLRATRKVSVSIVDQRLDGDLFIVTARARMPDGRQDEDVGAVNIANLRGEARANAIMKAMTKAKRRVTLSVCGLGHLDESEVETIDGTAYDVDPPPPPVLASDPSPTQTTRTPLGPPRHEEEEKPKTIGQFLEGLDRELETAPDSDAINALLRSERVELAKKRLSGEARQRLAHWLGRAEARLLQARQAEQAQAQADDAAEAATEDPAAPDTPIAGTIGPDGLPEDIEHWPVVGEEKLMAG